MGSVRGVTREQGVVDELLRAEDRLRLGEVVGQLRSVRLGPFTVELFERFRDPCVEASPAGQ